MCVFHFRAVNSLLRATAHQKNVSLVLNWLLVRVKRRFLGQNDPPALLSGNNLGLWIFKRVRIKFCVCLCICVCIRECFIIEVTYCKKKTEIHTGETIKVPLPGWLVKEQRSSRRTLFSHNVTWTQMRSLLWTKIGSCHIKTEDILRVVNVVNVFCSCRFVSL